MQNNFFGSKLNTVLLFILIILMIVAIRFMFQDKETYIPILDTNEEVVIIDKTMNPIFNEDQMLGSKDDLISFSIASNTKVKGILSYRGSIKGGYFFEANILINILDSNKNIIKQSNAVATTDWMTAEAVEFEGNMDFTGLPKGNAYFEIHNDNASGLPENDKSILIPIIIT